MRTLSAGPRLSLLSFDRPAQQIYHPRAMGQRRRQPAITFFFKRSTRIALPFVIVFALAAGGCDRKSPVQKSISNGSAPTVVSLVPAATDIVIGMNAQDHLVGVSNFDENPATAKLPRLGDYLTTDWEKIGELRPQVIVTQYAADRTPEGFSQNAGSLGIRQINLHVDRLDDVFAAIGVLGEACGEPAKAADAEKRLRGEIADVRRRVAGRAPIRVLIVTDDAARQAAGPETFLNDLLVIAGGENVLPPTAPPYPSIDREKLAALSPQVVLQLLPSSSPQVREQARQAWLAIPQLPAVKNHRVYPLTEWNVELPGYHIGALVSVFADLIHPEVAHSSQPPGPSTRPTP